MQSRNLFVVILTLTLTAGGARAQNYTLKIKEFPSPGKSMTVTKTEKANNSFKVALGGMVLKEEKKTEVEETEYTEKVLVGGPKRPQKFSRTFTKSVKGEPGNLIKKFQEGKTVLFDLQGDKYSATVDGGMPKDAEGMQALKKLAESASKNSFGETVLPREPVPVGGSWAVPGKAVLAELPDFKDIDPAAVKAKGKLLKAYKKDGQQWGVLEVVISLPVKNLGEALKLSKAIPLELKATLDVPIDGSSTAGTIVGSISMKGSSEFTQNNMTFMLDVAVEGEFRTQQSAEK